ncbi:DUF6489 family protein [Hyphobacterium sp.]|uniref:DUF6489 family protein n=1 Tax=Hyphobacterium sp. TaxID=2004662 RepID=UPI003BAB4ED0
MKVKLDIDCTPAEARAFFGLPDVSKVNDVMVEEMTKRMQENVSSLDPDVMMRNWMSFGGQMQDQFMALMQQAGQAKKD